MYSDLKREASVPSDPMAEYALEKLRNHVRSPTATLPYRWCASNHEGREVYEPNELHALVAAWNHIDPDLSVELIHAALFTQRDDGAIPAWTTPNGTLQATHPCRPLIAQSAHAVWTRTNNHAFAKNIAPVLQQYLSWAIRYFDPEQKGVPHWQRVEESFTRDTYDAGLAHAGLLCFFTIGNRRFCRTYTGGERPPGHAGSA